MNIGVLGTGIVGQTIAAKLAGLEHSVMIGTRDPGVTTSRTDPDMYGGPPFPVLGMSNIPTSGSARLPMPRLTGTSW
jgi:hypothetical protein